MTEMLYELYNGDYDITPERNKKQQELEKKICAEWDRVQRIFGDEFMDRLMDLEGEREDWRNYHYYRAGFCLGARLMMEALTPA